MIVNGIKIITNLLRDDVNFIQKYGKKIVEKVPYKVNVKVEKKGKQSWKKNK